MERFLQQFKEVSAVVKDERELQSATANKFAAYVSVYRCIRHSYYLY
jgi:hypothetical protein